MVSIIIPVYNCAAYLAETLESVKAQTYNNWECVIMNDGSIDDSESVALHYAASDNRFRYIRQENQGVVAARNHAIEESRGEFILPIDGDDLIDSRYLELAVPILEERSEVSVVCCQTELFGAINGRFVLPPPTLRNELHDGCCVISSLFRRKDFDKVGGFKECMKNGLEDWEFFISLMELGGEVVRIEQPLFRYRILEGSRNRSIPVEVRSELIRNIVTLHAETYHREYQRLINDYERRAFFRVMATLMGEGRLWTKITKAIKIIRKSIYDKNQ